jgi:anti-anti-sigma factor
MKLTKQVRGDAALLTVQGEFDSFVCNPFIEQIDRLAEEGVTLVALSMKGIKFINSTGVGCIIKSRKKLKELDGDLVIARPSGFVRESLESLGLTGVLKVFDTDEAALQHFKASDGVDMGEGNNVLVHPAGKRSTPVVSRIRKLEEEGIHFEVDDPDTEMAQGMPVKLKFRVPLFRKSHYFDITAEITEIVHSTGGATVKARFTQISDEDRTSIGQFVKDMQFLRKEAGR